MKGTAVLSVLNLPLTPGNGVDEGSVLTSTSSSLVEAFSAFSLLWSSKADARIAAVLSEEESVRGCQRDH